HASIPRRGTKRTWRATFLGRIQPRIFRPRHSCVSKRDHRRCVHAGGRAAVELSTVRPAVPMFLPRSLHWAMGVDLGQSSDPTAIAVIQHTIGVNDPNSEYERHTGTGMLPQTPAARMDVRHLERLPLGMCYPAVVEHVRNLLARPPLNGDA